MNKIILIHNIDADVANAIANPNTAALISTSDELGELNQYSNVFTGIILAPPALLLNVLIDSGPMTVQQPYEEYLDNVANSFILSMIAMCMQNKLIFLHIPNDEFQLFGMLLLGYLERRYGMRLGTPFNDFVFNEQYQPSIVADMYMYNMTERDVLYYTFGKYGMQLPQKVVQKMITEDNNTINNPYEYYNIFTQQQAQPTPLFTVENNQ